MKPIVYTALFGAYDNGLPVFAPNDNFEFHCFTNQKRLKSDCWQMHYVDMPVAGDVARSAYWYKWHPHLLFANSEYSIWMDSSGYDIKLDNIYREFKRFSESGDFLHIERHPSRSHSLKEEMEVNCYLNKDDVSVMREQVNGYYRNGYKDGGYVFVPETGFMFKKHNDPRMIELSDIIWNDMGEGKTKRDQLVFSWGLWKTGYGVGNGVSQFTFEHKMNDLVKFRDHKHRSSHMEKVALVGPWLGEDHLEESWVEYVNGVLKNTPVDTVVVGCKKGREELYSSLSPDKIVSVEPKGFVFRHLVDGKVPSFDVTSNNKELVRICPETAIVDAFSESIGKVVVLYNWFEHKDPSRKNEMLFALKHICQSQIVDSVVICSNDDDRPPIQNSKIKYESCSNRPTYRELFDIGNRYVEDLDVQILINSDCFFDELSLRKIATYIRPKEFWAVSRTELLTLSSYENRREIFPGGSQDAWCVRGKVPDCVVCDFRMGIPACDHRIAFEFYNVKYDVKNHCDDLILYHAHISKDRSYTSKDSLLGNGLHILPTPIGTPQTNVSFFRIFSHTVDSL